MPYCNFIEINNFKSIQHLHIPAARVNLFIGKPNVGKSNILEAIGLFSLPYLQFNKTKKITDLVRCNDFTDLFPFSDIKKEIRISADWLYLTMGYNSESYNLQCNISTNNSNGNSSVFHSTIEDKTKTSFSQFEVSSLRPDFPKLYRFEGIKQRRDVKVDYLVPPNGLNASALIQRRTDIAQYIGEYLSEYNLDLVLDRDTNRIKIQRRSKAFIEQLPIALVADTLQRVMFTFLAIKTNTNSTVILEEPEAHTYPQYITAIAKEIVDTKSNQFFVATHSPYLLTEIIETLPPQEVNVFVTKYEDYETRIQKLEPKEISEILSYGEDIFLTLEKYYNYAL